MSTTTDPEGAQKVEAESYLDLGDEDRLPLPSSIVVSEEETQAAIRFTHGASMIF